jgi:hypothetical protein
LKVGRGERNVAPADTIAMKEHAPMTTTTRSLSFM